MPENPEPARASPAALLKLFPIVMLPMFLAMIDSTIVVTALPTIAADLGDAENIAWVMVAYLVTSTIAAPVYGRLGDHFGRRKLMFIALAMFMVSSVLCAMATSVTMLVLSRVLHGFGGGGLMTLSQALVGEVVRPRDRGRMQGYLATVAITSSTFGPVAGGFLTQYIGWQSVFLVNIPIAIVAVLFLLKMAPRPAADRALNFDFLGLIFLATFVTSILLLLQQVRVLPSANVVVVVGLLVLNLIAIVLLIRRERRALEPLIPLGLFRNGSIWRSDAMAACHGAILVSLMTFLPILLRVTHGMSPSQIGIAMIPLVVGVGVGSMITGQLISWTDRTVIFPRIGMPVVTLAVIIIAFWSPTASAVGLCWALGATALFMGTAMTVVQVTVQAEADPEMLGSAAGTVQFSRSLGAGFGTATVGAVLFAMLAMESQDMAQLFGEILRHGPEILGDLPVETGDAIAGEISLAFRGALLSVAAFGVLGSYFAWTIPRERI